MFEQQFLENEGADAKAGLTQALDDLKVDLLHGADVRVWARNHPWATVGVAAAAGFALAAALTPRRDETMRDRMNHLAERVKMLAPEDAEPRKAGLGSALIGRLFDLAKVAAGNAIMMAIRSRMDQYSGPLASSGDGCGQCSAESTSSAKADKAQS
jgi:hypothetical protein